MQKMSERRSVVKLKNLKFKKKSTFLQYILIKLCMLCL